jgi:hypothetical protein
MKFVKNITGIIKLPECHILLEVFTDFNGITRFNSRKWMIR